MKIKELSFDRKLVGELSKGNAAFYELQQQIVENYKMVKPTIINVKDLKKYAPKSGEVKINFPDRDLFWLRHEESEAPNLIAFAKGSSASFSEPNDWNFYSLENVNLIAVVGSFYSDYIQGNAVGFDLYVCSEKTK